MLVVIAIMSLFLGVVFFYSKGASKVVVLNRALNQLSSDIARVRTYSMGALERKDNKKICGWGIYFLTESTSSYYLFVDLVDQESSCSESDHVWSGQEETAEKINLEEGVLIDNSSFSDLLFIPPNPDIVFNGNYSISSGTITLKVGRFYEDIKITKSGQITFERFNVSD